MASIPDVPCPGIQRTQPFNMHWFISFLLLVGLVDAFQPFASVARRHQSTTSQVFSTVTVVEQGLSTPKEQLLDLLKSGEDDNSPKLTPYLEELYDAYTSSGIDARVSENPTYIGDWVNLNLPNFPGGSGRNEHGQPLYTLGRLTFNKIPNGSSVMVASEKMVQRVRPHDGPLPQYVPPALKDAVTKDPSKLLAFSIDTYFTVEENRDLKGVIRAEGYVYPHEDHPNRFESFFARGRCFSRTTKYKEWNDVFGGAIGSERQRIQQWFRSKFNRNQEVMVEDTSLSYSLKGPVAAYATVVYLDDDFRVTIGQEGSRMINRREA